MKLQIKIVNNAGEEKIHTAQPPEWRKWEIETKQKISADPSLGISDLMFLAYHAAKRENAGKPILPIESWCETVADIEVLETSANPTNAVASDD
jgi:hypothetical protein